MRRVLENISFNFISRILSYLFSFANIIYVTRIFTPESYGSISFANSFTGYFIMLASFGLPIYAMRTCAAERKERQKLSIVFNELWSISVILSICSIFLLSIVVLSINKLHENKWLFIIYGCSIIFNLISCEWLYKGLEKFRFLALSSLIFKFISFICIILFVKSEEQIIPYAALSVLASYGNSIISFLMLHRYVDISFHLRINSNHIKPLVIFFMMTCAVYIYSNLDLTMLGFMKSNYEVGLYSIAAKGKDTLTLTGSLVWNSLLPIATSYWKDEKRSAFQSLASKSLVIVCLIQSCITIICLVFAKHIVSLLYGEAFLESITAFRILILSLVPIGASNILGGLILIPAGKEKYLLKSEICGALFNFVANLIIIPFLSFNGAAIISVVSEIIVWTLCVLYIKDDLGMDFGVTLLQKIIEYSKKKIQIVHIRIKSRIFGDRLPYYCPCCDTYLKNFKEGWYKQRPDIVDPDRYMNVKQDVVCPCCDSISRHRILASWLNDNKDCVLGKNILCFAQEKSIKMWMHRNGISYTTADLFAEADLKINIEDTGLEQNSYDVIICNHVLEHVDDFRRALNEVYRILAPGGSFICSFPIDSQIELLDEDARIVTDEERRLRFGQIDHKRVFGKHADKLLIDAGFLVERINGDNFPDEILPVVGPANYDINLLFRCVKPRKV